MSDPERVRVLKNIIRGLDMMKLPTPKIIEACEARLPEYTRDEIIHALREVGKLPTAEADELLRFKEVRQTIIDAG